MAKANVRRFKNRREGGATEERKYGDNFTVRYFDGANPNENLIRTSRYKDDNGVSAYSSNRVYNVGGRGYHVGSEGHVSDRKSKKKVGDQYDRLLRELRNQERDLLRAGAGHGDERLKAVMNRMNKIRNAYAAYSDYKSMGSANG